MNLIKKEKDTLRETYKAKRHAMEPKLREERDLSICRAASELVSFRYADYILLYAATDDEIDVSYISEAAWKSGKKVAFPRCDKESHTMSYHFVNSLDELSPEAYGISEPPADAPIYDSNTETGSAVCFVPGLLYDKAGFRLGYGKGFYDRYLSEFIGSKIGVVYSDYVVPTVPRGRYDISVDVLLTEKGTVAVKRKK